MRSAAPAPHRSNLRPHFLSGQCSTAGTGPNGQKPYTQGPYYDNHQDKYSYAQYLLYTYSIYQAKWQGGGWRQQDELCSAGGSSTSNGYHQVLTGGEVMYNGTSNQIIGWQWYQGSTPSTVSASLGFALSSGVVTASGSVSATPQDANAGGQGPSPAGIGDDEFPNNEVNGYWDGRCDWCGIYAGTADWEGAVTHGLWQFPDNGNKYSFTWTFYMEDGCSLIGGC